MKKQVVGIVGLGYVGLPIAVELANKDFDVVGIDIDRKRLEELKNGKSYIVDVENEVLQQVIASKLKVTHDYSQVNRCDSILICVPTPLTESKEPDVSYIVSAVDEIIKYMKKGTLIVLESTTYPGTTKELIAKRVEKERGYKVGKDFNVCYSPERVDPGNKQFQVMNIPKVIGGITQACTFRGKELYESFLPDIVCVSSTEAAELSKLVENTFRGINIAFVNELAMMCERMQVDVWEVISAAATKPFGFMPFYPGPGIGGHCIPLDPLYLSWEGKKHNYFNRFIELAADINNNMPHYVVRQIQDILDTQGKTLSESHLLLIGIAYKKDIDDVRESPSLEVYKILHDKGVKILCHDPNIESFRFGEEKIEMVPLLKGTLEEADLVVILTDHSQVDYALILESASLIYDTRNAMKYFSHQKLHKLGQPII